MKQNILLLTSTIKPKSNQPDLLLLDPLVRLSDYKKALAFYFEQLNRGVIQKVIYVDNSGYDLSELQIEFKHPDIEFISFYGLDYDEGYHRGYGEFKLIDHAYSTSKTLGQLDANSAVWKVSGRYIVKNLACVVNASPKWFDLYLTTRKNWAEMSVMAWNKKGYEKIIKGLGENFKSGFPPEITFAEILKNQSLKDVKVIFAFRWPPYLIARKGTDANYFEGNTKVSGCSLSFWLNLVYCF